MYASHITRTDEGDYACRYCGRHYPDAEGAEEHLGTLARAGMLQDHIAIHWSERTADPQDGAAPRPRSWIEAFTMRFEE